MAKKSLEKKTSVVIPWEIVEQDFKDMNEKLGLNNIKLTKQPKLIISNYCHSHIRALHIHSPNTEWLALCKIVPQWDWVFKLVDMIHPEQKNLSAECEPTDKGLDWAVDFLIENKENLWQWNCILHSHHHMGVFWSWTDDNARLGYNDWRFMCWAVVTAYDWTPETWDIHYKSCVNFYKPYNIELDADVEVEEGDFYKECVDFEQFDTKRNEEISELAKKIFEERVEEKANDINALEEKPDYSRLLNYLGMDISEELEENYEEVRVKMPSKKLEEFYKTLQWECLEEAVEIIGQEPATISDEALEWKEWSDTLIKQLDDHKVSTIYQYWKSLGDYGNWWDYEWNKLSKKEKKKIKKEMKKEQQKALDFYKTDHTYEDDWYYLEKDKYFYNTTNYPTKEILKSQLGLSPYVWVYDDHWVWTAYNPVENTREPVDDCIEDLYANWW